MKTKFLIGLLVVVLGVIGTTFVLTSQKTLVFHPKGVIAKKELELIITNIFLMLSIIVPTYICLCLVVWKYCIKKEQANQDLNQAQTAGPLGELMMWLLPSMIVAVMAFITWNATHKLNPYQPLASEVKPLTIQVIALDWKWLFIYPEQGIATLNYLHIPEQTPIHFELTADNSPMNSFWIPQLSGQIYSMAGMMTQLYLMADGPGEYVGRAVEINGEGYSDMTFAVKSTSQKGFEAWIAQVQQSSLHLTEDVYNEMLKPSVNRSVSFFSKVDKHLYHQVVHKYMYPATSVL